MGRLIQLFWKSRVEARLVLRSLMGGTGAVGEPAARPDIMELVSWENTELMGVEETGRAIGGCFTSMVVFSVDPLLM